MPSKSTPFIVPCYKEESQIKKGGKDYLTSNEGKLPRLEGGGGRLFISYIKSNIKWMSLYIFKRLKINSIKQKYYLSTY